MAEECGNQAAGKWSLHLLRNGEIVPFGVSLWDTPLPRRSKATTGGQNQTENENWKDALAANGRRASKEGGIPVPDYRGDFKQHRRRGSESDQDNHDHHDREGHYRVHRDAQWALVSAALDRMRMHYLGYSQQHQQDQANDSRCPQSA